MHLTLNIGVTPRSAIRANFSALRRIKSLFEMDAHPPKGVAGCAFAIVPPERVVRLNGRRRIGFCLVEHLKLKKSDAKSRRIAGFLSVIYYFGDGLQ